MSTQPINPNIIQLEVVKHLTVPFLIIEADGKPYYLRFDTAIEADKTQFSERVRASKKDDPNQSQEKLHIATVTNVETGEVFRLVAHSVLESQLNESYPDGNYAGKIFCIKKVKATGKRYFNFDITEMRVKEQPKAPTAPAARK